MISHIFKLIWKKKTSNFLLTLEIFFSFFVLFAVYSFATYFYQNYKGGSGLEAENRWVVFLEFNKDTTAKVDLVKQKLKTYPEVESFSFSANNVPFSFSSSNSELHYNNQAVLSEIMNVEPNYHETMGMPLSEGRWFTTADTVGDKFHPIVITRALKEALFGQEEAVGKSWSEKDDAGNISQTYKVMGVVDYFKHKHDFQERSNTFFHPFTPHRTRNAVLLKMRPGADAEFEAKMTKELLRLGSGWSVEIQHLSAMKANQNLFIWIPMLIALGVCFFLAINVALGLFGVLFQNINRRRGEIGLRRAMGATKKEVQWQFLGETAMLTTFGVFLGLFFAVQFPLLAVFDVKPSVYVGGMILATLTVYALTLLCAWYPSRQAAMVFPAEALREE